MKRTQVESEQFGSVVTPVIAALYEEIGSNQRGGVCRTDV